ncbi:MAG TPA: TIGR00366 family protein, partial [Cryomorphaceae bacterium]|nr:TIGR00366 family protein [Cryomorphaceae bacterium]
MPSPFTLAVGLSFFVLAVAILFFRPEGLGFVPHTADVIAFWYEGIWNGPFLVFAYQMILILVLGHVLALTKPANLCIDFAAQYCNTTPKAAMIVSFVCILLGLINWGMALIFGAIFARKIAERATRKGLSINYPLIAASGYTGLMVWHGGFSGSSLIKVAEKGHLTELVRNSTSLKGVQLPEHIGFSETVLSQMNLSVSVALLLVVPFGAYALGKNSRPTRYILRKWKTEKEHPEKELGWAEKFDYKLSPALALGFLALVTAVVIAAGAIASGENNFVNPNFLNIVFLGLGLIGHGSLANFGEAVKQAIPGASGILIQFPLYFGIMGVMQNAGIVQEISAFVVSVSTPLTYYINTFLSAGFVNILVPSGGGQWMVQGPILIEASNQLNLPLAKSIMAMAYGDQITNMLQP